jgi:hypothetical protein
MGRHITKKDAVGTEWFWVKEKEVTKILNESNKETEKAFPRDKNLSKINKKSGIKLLMLLCLPVAIFIDATTLAVPAFIISVLSVFIKDD